MVLKLQVLGQSIIIRMVQELIMARIHDVDVVVAAAPAFHIAALIAAPVRMAVEAVVDRAEIEGVDMIQSRDMTPGRRDDEILRRPRVKKNVANGPTRPRKDPGISRSEL